MSENFAVPSSIQDVLDLQNEIIRLEQKKQTEGRLTSKEKVELSEMAGRLKNLCIRHQKLIAQFLGDENVLPGLKSLAEEFLAPKKRAA